MWYIPDASNADLNRISDIFDYVRGKFLTYQQLTQKFGPVLYILTYCRIVASILPMWKVILKQKIVGEATDTGLDIFPQGTKASKFCYWNLNEKYFSTENDPSGIMWATELNVDITVKNWKTHMSNFYKYTTCSKLRFLQYRQLNKKLTTNKRRVKWGNDVSIDCSFCRTHPGTVMLLLIECTSTARIWTSLKYMA